MGRHAGEGVRMSTRGHHGLLMGRVIDVVSRLDFTVMPNGTVATDDTGKSWTFNSGGGSVSISSGALVTSGGGHLLTPSTSEWNFGADEFCIEAIVKFTARAERPVLGKWYSYGPTSWLCGLGTSGGKQSFYINAAPGGETYPATTPVSLGTTYHMAWYHRAGSNFYSALDGVVTSVRTNGTVSSNSTDVTIGAIPGAAGGLGMKLYQLRVRRGPGTAYPATNFTPPSSI